MRKLVLLCASVCAMVLLFSAGPVRAQNVMFVSPNGSDANSCAEAAPCLTFQGAYNKGNVSQINCLGSGLYGPITIRTSLIIDCGTGNVGNIVSSSTDGISIITTAPATIVLRHLALDGLASSNLPIAGIIGNFFSGTLIVEDCMIHGYAAGTGIFFVPSGGRGLLQVSNTEIFANADGIDVSPTPGQIASATLNRVELVGNSNVGLRLNGGVVAGSMRHSVLGENGEAGLFASADHVFFTVEESSIVDNLSVGIQTVSTGAVVNVGASTIGGNGTGVQALAGSLISFGNNQMSSNGSNGTFTSTTALQ